MIRRSIIYDDYFEIFVLKIDHWLKIVLISKVSCIVESWHHDTERKLGKIEVILFRKSILFLLYVVSYLLINMDIRMRDFVVIHCQHKCSLCFIHRHLETSIQNLPQISYLAIIECFSYMIVYEVYSQLKIFIFVVYIFYHLCRARVA